MIRLLFLMWFHAVLLTVARGEVVERAYYFGSKEQLLSEMNNDGDPFAEDDPEVAPEAEKVVTRLQKAPFKSRYISAGDRLWDVSSQFEDDSGVEVPFEWAVFNETTGWLILKGETKELDRVGPDVQSVILSLPRSIHLHAKIFLVPTQDWGISSWKVSELEKSHQCLLEAEVMTPPGMEALVEGEKGAIKLRFEPQVGSSDEVIDMMSLTLSGTVKGYSFDLMTRLSGFNGVPSVIELGAIGNGESLVLVMRPDIYLPGGVKSREAVQDRSKPVISPYERMIPPSPEELWPPDPKTGKVFSRFMVSPTFIGFLDSGGGGEEERFMIKSWNSKVIAKPGERVFDVRPLLELQGVVFGEGDFAILVSTSGTLVAELDPKNMELLNAIVTAPRPSSPRIIALNFSLVEGEEKIEASDLSQESLKGKFKTGFVAWPGGNGVMRLKKGDLSILLEPEAQVGGWDNVIDLRGKLVFSEGKEVLLEWNSGVTLISGKKEIVSSYTKDGKWYALVVEARVEVLEEWLFRSE